VEWLRNGEHAGDPRIACCAELSPAPTWPVAFALACTLASGTADTADNDAKDDAEQALLALAFGWAENMAQAAMKSVPLGQAAAQRILTRLTQAIPEAVQQALALPDEARQAFTPGLAILSARHENQYSRLFRS
jgi:urease accessory protein